MNENTNGEKRIEILDALRTQNLIVATKQKLPIGLIEVNSTVTCLTTSTPDKDGEAVLVFTNESALQNRNEDANPTYMDLSSIITMIAKTDLLGIVVISSKSWIYFPTQEIVSTSG